MVDFSKFLKKPAPTPESQELATAVRAEIADERNQEAILSSAISEVIYDGEMPDWFHAESLVDADFPFDDSQLEAIEGMLSTEYACLTGAAGTGKTTVTKRFVDRLKSELRLGVVDMRSYWKQAPEGIDSDDNYEMPETKIPSIVMCGFTGRSAQMIARNFPQAWRGNIMTIHRMLGFAPVWYEAHELIEKEGISDKLLEAEARGKKLMRFEPTYTADFKMPWDIIIIDEAGMVGLDLWHMIYAAMKDGCRVYMIGDINQLPPVHGRSIFGFAMARWPSYELNKVHRQKGQNNPIVDNAWRVIQGQMPRTEGKFQLICMDNTPDASTVSRKVQAIALKLRKDGIYDPNRDSIITATNGDKPGMSAYLGQIPLNEKLSVLFNPEDQNPRYVIDGGRERKYFAVGDRVMATRNDWEIGITNGMTGIITSIVDNGEYMSDARRFGLAADVRAFIANESADDEHLKNFSLESLSVDDLDAHLALKERVKESADRGPSSHIITVRFGSEEHGVDVVFSTLAEVGSLMTAYAMTCHKMQGGEAPVVIIICHDSHRRMMYREWLYTAITRASQICIVIYTTDAMRAALGKQTIKGKTLAEKVQSFNRLQTDNGLGASIEVRLPESKDGPSRSMVPARSGTNGLAELQRQINAKKATENQPKPEPVKPEVVVVERVVERHFHHVQRVVEPVREVDGGDLTPKQTPEEKEAEQRRIAVEEAKQRALNNFARFHHAGHLTYGRGDAKLVSQYGAYRMARMIEDAQAIRLLPAPKPVAPTPPAKGLWALKAALAAKKGA